MRQVVFRAAAGGILLLSLIPSLSCGQDQKLVAITVTPNGFTYSHPQAGIIATFTAKGQFVHPPETRDISSQVVWSSNFPAIFTVDPSTGVLRYLGGCASNLPVTATASSNLRLPPTGNIVTGTALISITQTRCTA